MVAYLKCLASNHAITLISFEKKSDFADKEKVFCVEKACALAGINWKPLTYHKQPRLLATAWDVGLLFWYAWRSIRSGRIELVHTRSYIPAFVALLLKRLTGVPFIFDMRAFWPDEMVSAGRLKKKSLIYKLLKRLEHRCLIDAYSVVTLTEAAAEYLKRQPSYRGVRFHVIPTCADLATFCPQVQAGEPDARESFVLGCIGTVSSGWFLLDRLLVFYKALLVDKPDAVLRVITRDQPQVILDAAEKHAVGTDQIEIFSLPHDEMPQAIRQFHAAIMFFVGDFSKLGSCPTRMGEILGCGVPCVANAGVGDVGEIIERYNVGVLAADEQEETMRDAAKTLLEFVDDTALPQRCRHAAENWFSLDSGVEKYDAIYRAVLGNQ